MKEYSARRVVLVQFPTPSFVVLRRFATSCFRRSLSPRLRPMFTSCRRGSISNSQLRGPSSLRHFVFPSFALTASSAHVHVVSSWFNFQLPASWSFVASPLRVSVVRSHRVFGPCSRRVVVVQFPTPSFVVLRRFATSCFRRSLSPRLRPMFTSCRRGSISNSQLRGPSSLRRFVFPSFALTASSAHVHVVSSWFNFQLPASWSFVASPLRVSVVRSHRVFGRVVGWVAGASSIGIMIGRTPSGSLCTMIASGGTAGRVAAGLGTGFFAGVIQRTGAATTFHVASAACLVDSAVRSNQVRCTGWGCPAAIGGDFRACAARGGSQNPQHYPSLRLHPPTIPPPRGLRNCRGDGLGLRG